MFMSSAPRVIECAVSNVILATWANKELITQETLSMTMPSTRYKSLAVTSASKKGTSPTPP